MKKIIRFFYFLILLSLMIILAYKNISPVWQRVHHSRENYAQAAEKYRMFEVMLQKSNIIKQALSNNEQDYHQIIQPLPVLKNFPDFLNKIIQNTQHQGLIFNTVKIQPAVLNTPDFYQQIPVEIILSGSYMQFLAFLKHLQTQHYLVHVDNFTLTRELPPVTTVLKSENSPDILRIQGKLIFDVVK